MELQLYLDILKRRALVIALVAALAMTVVTTVGIFGQPVYTARTTVRVLLDVGVADFRLWEDYNKRLLNTNTHVLQSGPILEDAISRLSPRTSSLSVRDLRDKVEIEIVPDTELIAIAVEDGDPALAQDLADMLSTLLIEYAKDLYVGGSKSARRAFSVKREPKKPVLSSRARRSSVIRSGRTSSSTSSMLISCGRLNSTQSLFT